MQIRTKVSFGGMLILLSIFFGIVASEIIVYLNTTMSSILGLPFVVAMFLGLALILGFVGFYLISEIISVSEN
ncbi:MAG: hypothetical protein JSW05_09500 [Candidatus Thorarchaeota archaeon]|nr:MAG: hypothetical protein JSW05_09500 [Candidatus Thorarchaeota archaeon]